MVLKLFVWEGALYGTASNGSVFVLAESKEEAWVLLQEKDKDVYRDLHGGWHFDPVIKEPEVVEHPSAYIVYGAD